MSLSSNDSSAFGIWLSQSDQILNVKARRKTQSSSPSKLEAADIAFARGEHTRALQLYAEQNSDNSDLQTVQESIFKQSLSLTALERNAEADELISNLAIQDGDQWPPYAACKLWLRRLQQKKQIEADQLLEFITSRFQFDEFVSIIPEEVRYERPGRPNDALTFFTQVLKDGKADTALVQEAQRQFDRLKDFN